MANPLAHRRVVTGLDASGQSCVIIDGPIPQHNAMSAALAWRSRPRVAFGLTIGVMIGWIIAATAGPPHLQSIPVWLPPLPFAVVAVTLFCLGVLAWRSDDEQTDEQTDETPPGTAGPPSTH